MRRETVSRRPANRILLFRAPFVVIDAGRVVADGAVAVRDGRVIAAGPARAVARRTGLPARDAGDVVLVPGLVNAHVHLELSALRGRLRPSADFAAWVRAQLGLLAGWTRGDFVRSYRRGVRLALAAGTTAVGDVCRRSFLFREALRSPLRTVHHVEVIEPDPGRWEPALRDAALELQLAEVIGRAHPGSPAPCAGLSPHAPFTVSPPLYRALHRLARVRHCPLQTHLAETRAELEFLGRGTGAMRDLLTGAGRPLPFDRAPGLSPVAHLERLGVLRPPLVAVHANHLTREDIAALARRRVAVVFCPRSHAFFRHEPHPVRALRRAGVPVALGTDSLASNADLDLRAEMREAVGRCGLRPAEAWDMATAAGARALVLGAGAGTLREGAPADLVMLSRPRGDRAGDLLERLLEPDVRVREIRVEGKRVRPSSR
jgi:cytosine/adenosine deaminase-related metal-dependent hydrolase